ncbi:hypothetical protein XENOCAPTIV_013067 [Xenoophorus captivus]|uniref:Cystic fibrosis transmembrane conductance regulator n=1 Tax=Xenoophorus captivus TaxID=1517983 RepID=A0ABV0S701_9TELE
MQKSPVEDANFLSKFVFWWISPLLRKGFTKKLELSDVYKVPSFDLADTLSERLEREWDKEVVLAKGRPRLLKALARCFFLPFAFFGVLLYFGVSLFICRCFSSPYILYKPYFLCVLLQTI